MAPTVFVCSATGTQGGAVARQLRGIGWGVHTTTRNPESPAAKELSAIGVKITPGDWDNSRAFDTAIAGCEMLYLNLFPDLSDPTRELKWAKAIMSKAKAAGVRHIIYASVFPLEASALNNGGPGHELVKKARAAKVAIEEATPNAGIEHWTILRPGFFMANFLLPKVRIYPGAVESGVFTLGYGPEVRLPLVDHEDIAKFAVAAFQRPGEFGGTAITFASEMLTTAETLKLLAEASGKKIRGEYLSAEEVEARAAENRFLAMHAAVMPKMAQLVDMERLREAWGIPLGTFKGFLEREREAVVETYRDVPE